MGYYHQISAAKVNFGDEFKGHFFIGAGQVMTLWLSQDEKSLYLK